MVGLRHPLTATRMRYNMRMRCLARDHNRLLFSNNLDFTHKFSSCFQIMSVSFYSTQPPTRARPGIGVSYNSLGGAIESTSRPTCWNTVKTVLSAWTTSWSTDVRGRACTLRPGSCYSVTSRTRGPARWVRSRGRSSCGRGCRRSTEARRTCQGWITPWGR